MSISSLIFTLNCGKRPPFDDEFYDKLSDLLEDTDLPQLLVFGLQEMTSILEGTSPDTIQSILMQISERLVDTISARYDVPFNIVAVNHFGSIGIILISAFLSKFHKIVKSVGIPVGLFFSSTKGATGVRIQYEWERGKYSELTFVSLHLNAGEGPANISRRCEDLLSICQGMSFPDGYGVLKPRSHCFLMGDFNFRALNNSFDFAQDEKILLIQKERGIVCEFSEAPVTFSPTYKIQVGSTIYNAERIPSWCDRILFLDYKRGDTSSYDFKEYNSLASMKISDHVPVYLKVKMPSEPPDSIINSRGFLIDRSTNLSDNELRLLPSKLYDYYRAIGKGKTTDRNYSGDILNL
ncbi:hypothetical protein FOA43_003860 [Brettanomyces nanus]|uniref:Inositol polyphosphate-related phosphatase domain-containing protein n=1 Tax=Eeniella nana TaxID=13502 RepID=A0A875S497_EENNA|nr:uncharacterized protein FOA43_003860 [Brettanomyces nanus]QPG76471.1 hypothetical protein FOA43_003860 [Brettanomyces nanus]